MKEIWKQYVSLIKSVVKPALGCTEPIAAAYAAAVAASMLDGKPDSVEVFVSDNLYKNSMGVFVPKTGKIGLHIATAVGLIGGNPDAGLEVLASITPEHVKAAQDMIDAGMISVSRCNTEEFIYCHVRARCGARCVEVITSGGHTRILEKRINGEIVYQLDESKAAPATGGICDGVDIDIAKIHDFATQAPFDEIKFILQAATLNSALSDEGMQREYGLQIGRTMRESVEDGITGDDLMNRIAMAASAASDARMGGASLPAMSNYGSGNQGIVATMPVVAYARHAGASDEQLARALIMSHLGAIYIKTSYPPLSAFCGNTATASAAAMAMVYLSGGDLKQCNYAIQNVLSDTSGMICDGAKSTCAMKVGSAAVSAVKGTMLAKKNRWVRDQGIIADDVETTIRNLGRMVEQGMKQTDTQIIEIMSA